VITALTPTERCHRPLVIIATNTLQIDKQYDMKKIAIILFLCFGLETFAQSDCEPMLKEIYSFEIGDVYNYKYTNYDWSTGTGSPDVKSYFLAFEVKNKMVKGDTLIYIIDGFLPPTTITQFDYDPFMERVYVDTLVLIDSINHNLNQCADSIIKFQFPQEDSVFSRVIIEENDTLILKKLGGMNNLLQYSENELESFYGFDYEEKYAANLGLIYQDFYFFEFAEKVELASYIKGGDTTILITSVDFSIKETDFKLYPNPVQDKLNLNLEGFNGNINIKIIDSYGRLVTYKKILNENDFYSLDFSSLSNGLYIIEVMNNKGKVTQKVLKK